MSKIKRKLHCNNAFCRFWDAEMYDLTNCIQYPEKELKNCPNWSMIGVENE